MISNEFMIPQFVKIDEGANDGYSRILVEPFERGYGTTIGNSLRRVLLASLEGTAITAIRFENIQHEFSAIPGVKEDVTDVVLNLKKCNIRLNDTESHIFTFHFKGEGVVTAEDLFRDQAIDVFNPGHEIFHSTSKTTDIQMEIKVARNRGFLTAEHFELQHAPLGTIYLDANFSPVQKVNFLVEDARVGQSIDYDRLILEIWTNGSISPEKALEEAANLLIEHFKIFVKQDQLDDGSAAGQFHDPELLSLLSKPVEDLELSVRAANCLKAAEIRTVGELVVREESEMLQFHNFGKKSLDEIKALLETMGLNFGMKFSIPLPEPARSTAKNADLDIDDDEGDAGWDGDNNITIDEEAVEIDGQEEE